MAMNSFPYYWTPLTTKNGQRKRKPCPRKSHAMEQWIDTLDTNLYNGRQQLQEYIEKEIDPVFKTMGMCCGTRHKFRPRALACYAHPANGCHVARDKPYYIYKDRYSVCKECFEKAIKECASPFKFVKIFRNQSDPSAIEDVKTYPESEFKFVISNSHEEPEPYLICSGECKRQFHSICVNFPENCYDSPFICNPCLQMQGKLPTDGPKRKYTSKSLPVNCLSRFLERRVRKLLRGKRGFSDAKEAAERTHIRVISSANKKCQVREKMHKTYSKSKFFPEYFSYKSKSIFAFQEDPSDNSEVCFFGMHVNEYDHESGDPNKKRVYISYLDSVFFFKPRKLKTAVYREIVLSYLDYVKQLGYHHGSIWSCPPSDGDDYIFYAHPKDQKIPKSQRLLNWYKDLLDSAIQREIVIEWNDLRKQANRDQMKRVTELPYFDGDFWPLEIERSITELVQQQLAEREETDALGDLPSTSSTRKARSRSNSGASTSSSKSTKSNKSGSSFKKYRNSTPFKKRIKLDESSQSADYTLNQSLAEKSCPAAENLTRADFHDALNGIILTKIAEQADVFFSLKLLDKSAPNYDSDIHDPDPVLNCPLFDGREAFLTFCRTDFLEFSTLRRAKYSTTCMLKAIHETLSKNCGFLIDDLGHVLQCPERTTTESDTMEVDTEEPEVSKDSSEIVSMCNSDSFCKKIWTNYLSKEKSDPSMSIMVKYGKSLLEKEENQEWTFDTLVQHLILQYYGYHSRFCDPQTCSSELCKTIRPYHNEVVTITPLEQLEPGTSGA